MKKTTFNIIALCALALGLSSCDQKNEPITNMAFINEAVTEPASEIILGATGEVTTKGISIRLAERAAVDTKLTLALDAEALDKYNKRNDYEYAVIPAEYIEFPTEVTIPAGSAAADIAIAVTSFDGEKGVDYAAPISIKAAEGVPVSTGSSSFVITFGKPLMQSAPGFVSSNAMEVPWPAEVELPNLTLEWWSRVTNRYGNGGYSINNQALFSFKANMELYVRFGDITYGSKYNFLQIKTMGVDANYDSGNPTDNPLQWGEWIHWAHTYDTATGDCKLYQNGVEVCKVNGGAGKSFIMKGLEMCGAGSYHRDIIEMAQVRLWKTTRTAAQIAKYMKKEVKYDDPNLVFYFPMNEGSGSTLHDVTGNGHDITIGSHPNNGGNSEAASWTDYTF